MNMLAAEQLGPMLLRRGRFAACLLLSASLAGCGTVRTVQRTVVGGPTVGSPVEQTDFAGFAVADEPRAASVGLETLAAGGSAADAAAAMGFALAVTLPSRAGLGAGGACLAYTPGAGSASRGVPQAVLFVSAAPAVRSGDRPAAAPMLPRGLLALQARFGLLPGARVLAPAERLARLGTPVSKALAADLAVVGSALLEDEPASAVFAPGGTVVSEGDTLSQTALADTLAAIRVRGVNDLHDGLTAQLLLAAMPAVGGGLTAADLAATVPHLAPPLVADAGKYRVAFLPPPADGGLAADAAMAQLQANPKDMDGAAARAAGAASRFRAGGVDAVSVLGAAEAGADQLTPLPASTSFIAVDRSGGAVACGISMGNLFGTGRMVPRTGMLLAASPAVVPPPLLAAAIAWSQADHAFRAAVSGSGQNGAALAVAAAMNNTLRSKVAMPSTVPSPGRANVVACPANLPGDASQCTAATDPRGDGYVAAD